MTEHHRNRVRVNWTVHPHLYALLKRRAAAERTPMGRPRSLSSLVEQALAEMLQVPLANRDLPKRFAELCPDCESALVFEDKCPACNWRRYPNRRPEQLPRRDPRYRPPRTDRTEPGKLTNNAKSDRGRADPYQAFRSTP